VTLLVAASGTGGSKCERKIVQEQCLQRKTTNVLALAFV
jgi:hypothetical protein